MTTTETASCPGCGGPQLVDHPAGWLAWRHSNECALRAAEDATQAADHDRLHSSGLHRPVLDREPTITEQALLSALGHPLPRKLTTRLEPVTAGIVRRSWPALEQTTPTTTGGTP